MNSATTPQEALTNFLELVQNIGSETRVVGQVLLHEAAPGTVTTTDLAKYLLGYGVNRELVAKTLLKLFPQLGPHDIEEAINIGEVELGLTK